MLLSDTLNKDYYVRKLTGTYYPDSDFNTFLLRLNLPSTKTKVETI